MKDTSTLIRQFNISLRVEKTARNEGGRVEGAIRVKAMYDSCAENQ